MPFPPLKILIILASFCQLINKSGSLFGRRRLTQDGLELTFALNHMAYFVLTEGLRERLLASRRTARFRHRSRSQPIQCQIASKI
jgi:hypothetical protein